MSAMTPETIRTSDCIPWSLGAFEALPYLNVAKRVTAEKYNFYEVGDISGLKWKMDGGDLVDSTKVLLCRCRKCIKLYHIYIM